MNARNSTIRCAVTALLAASAAAQAPWTILPSINTSPSSNQLYGVGGTGPNDVWAVGTYVDPSTGFHSLALHWDGAQWTHVPTPTPSYGDLIKAVAPLAPNDVWAIGGHGIPFHFHFDGASWTAAVLPSPGSANSGISVEDVVALAPDNVWAVGFYDWSGAAHLRTAVWHWNGTSWSVVPSPNVPNTSGGFYPSMLLSISAAAPDAIFAVGEWRVGNTWFPLALRWDGATWQRMTTPNPPSGDGRLRSVSAASPTNVWAVGTQDDHTGGIGGGYAGALAMHWDGSTWSVVPTPQPGVHGVNPLKAVYAADGHVHALGCLSNPTQGLDTFALHLDQNAGTGFTIVPSENPPGDGQGWNQLYDVGRFGDHLWAVGSGHVAFSSPATSLVERTPFASGASVFCAGDGTATPCPCSNAGSAAHGCAWSANPAGGQVVASGSASLGADTLVLHGSDMPNSSALYFQGTSGLNGGLGTTFGDGLRCVGGSIVRLGTKSNAAGASQYPAPGDAPISVRGQVTASGLRTYQVWYRNAAAFCSASTFNLTNGLSVTWTP